MTVWYTEESKGRRIKSPKIIVTHSHSIVKISLYKILRHTGGGLALKIQVLRVYECITGLLISP
jgi:hypothetical protein